MVIRALISGIAIIFFSSSLDGSSVPPTLRTGYVDIMPPAKAATYKALFPQVMDPLIQQILDSKDTMLYDSESIIPGYQDSMGDPKGFRPNTLDSSFINLAVPGGWQKLFERKGRFNFPFATGGADLSDNLVKLNFWSVPKENNKPLPVAYWKLPFSRWQWLFPVGTRIGEILLIQFPDGDLRVFEIRVRERALTKWNNSVYRPFLTAQDLAEAIKIQKPDWFQIPKLWDLMSHLYDSDTLSGRTLATKHFPGTFVTVDGSIDLLPDFGDPSLVKKLLRVTPFRLVGDTPWKSDGKHVTHAASTQSMSSIVPIHYDAGLFPVDDDSCMRCHKDAGRQIGEFHSQLILYGELWGEDETFSWHPFENSAFVDANGNVQNFNNDNRRLSPDLVRAGLVQSYNASTHPSHLYKTLAREWKYNPVRGENDRSYRFEPTH